MSNKQTIRITESKLEEMVYEAVSKKFKYLMSQASSSLCKDIYNFIDNKELEGVLYTRQDIIDHMMPSFMSKCKKFPSLPKDTLESCVDFMLKKMGKGLNYLNENKNTTVRITEDEFKNLVSESVKNVLNERYDDESNDFGKRVKDVMRCALNDIHQAIYRLDKISNVRGNHANDEDVSAAYQALLGCKSEFEKYGFDLDTTYMNGARGAEVFRAQGKTKGQIRDEWRNDEDGYHI